MRPWNPGSDVCRRLIAACLPLSIMLLAACGGGGGDDAPPPPDPRPLASPTPSSVAGSWRQCYVSGNTRLKTDWTISASSGSTAAITRRRGSGCSSDCAACSVQESTRSGTFTFGSTSTMSGHNTTNIDIQINGEIQYSRLAQDATVAGRLYLGRIGASGDGKTPSGRPSSLDLSAPLLKR